MKELIKVIKTSDMNYVILLHNSHIERISPIGHLSYGRVDIERSSWGLFSDYHPVIIPAYLNIVETTKLPTTKK